MNMVEDAAEAFFWLGLVALTIIYLVWRARHRKSSDADFKRGVADAKHFLAAGVMPVSIQSFCDVQKSRGLSGSYEAGLKSVLDCSKSELVTEAA